jgi:hypothetical protein
MNNLKRTAWCVALLAAAVALSACNADVSGHGMMGGTGWGQHTFRSNGERIYLTTTSERGTRIESTGGPSGTGWMMISTTRAITWIFCSLAQRASGVSDYRVQLSVIELNRTSIGSVNGTGNGCIPGRTAAQTKRPDA